MMDDDFDIDDLLDCCEDPRPNAFLRLLFWWWPF